MDQFVAPVSTPLDPVVTAKPRADIANLFFVLDRSGSMGSMKQQAIQGFNKYIADQRALDGVTKLTLVQFDDKREVTYDSQDVMSVQELTEATYRPDGYTALRDAVGWVLTQNLDKCPDDETNIIAILTDGQENASREYSAEVIKDLLAKAEAKGWEVLFLGANMSKASIVSTYGINANNVSVFAASAKGVSDAIGTLSATTSSYRGLKAAGNLRSKVDVEAVYTATAAAGPLDQAFQPTVNVNVGVGGYKPLDQQTIADIIAKAAAQAKGDA